MLLQKEGITDISPKYVFDFFDKERDLSLKSNVCHEAGRVLGYLENVFDKPTYELRKPGWIITLYLLASCLLKSYVTDGLQSRLRECFLNFYANVQRSVETGDKELVEFDFAISRGTTSRDNIKKRHEIIFRRLWECVGSLAPLDPKRGFTEEERIAVFRKYDGKCSVDGEDLQGKIWHAHHKKPWIEGGPTTIENAELLCDKHHNERHRTLQNL